MNWIKFECGKKIEVPETEVPEFMKLIYAMWSMEFISNKIIEEQII